MFEASQVYCACFVSFGITPSTGEVLAVVTSDTVTPYPALVHMIYLELVLLERRMLTPQRVSGIPASTLVFYYKPNLTRNRTYGTSRLVNTG